MAACNETYPSIFWKEFHKDLVSTKNCNQGPWGGPLEINWKSEIKNTFTEQELIKYAEKNEWKLLDSVLFSADALTKNSFSTLKIDDYSHYLFNENVLTKLKTNDKRIFIFKTTWLSVEPGNARETFANGFALLNSDITGLNVYHFWVE